MSADLDQAELAWIRAHEAAVAELVRQAREMYENENLQVDADAQLSEATDGVWVQAWVWVPTAEN